MEAWRGKQGEGEGGEGEGGTDREREIGKEGREGGRVRGKGRGRGEGMERGRERERGGETGREGDKRERERQRETERDRERERERERGERESERDRASESERDKTEGALRLEWREVDFDHEAMGHGIAARMAALTIARVGTEGWTRGSRPKPYSGAGLTAYVPDDPDQTEKCSSPPRLPQGPALHAPRSCSCRYGSARPGWGTSY